MSVGSGANPAAWCTVPAPPGPGLPWPRHLSCHLPSLHPHSGPSATPPACPHTFLPLPASPLPALSSTSVALPSVALPMAFKDRAHVAMASVRASLIGGCRTGGHVQRLELCLSCLRPGVHLIKHIAGIIIRMSEPRVSLDMPGRKCTYPAFTPVC